ncbi:hypothetical protein ACROYT_G032640 [Oculina patagonica]
MRWKSLSGSLEIKFVGIPFRIEGSRVLECVYGTNRNNKKNITEDIHGHPSAKKKRVIYNPVKRGIVEQQRDGNGVLCYGFAYKNGSNLRVVSWEDEQRHNRTIPSGQTIIGFPERVTKKGFGNKNFNEADFNFPSFNPIAQQHLQQELMAYNNNQKIEDDNFVKQMAGLNISPL